MHCGSRVLAIARFCPNCGKPLSDTTPEATPSQSTPSPFTPESAVSTPSSTPAACGSTYAAATPPRSSAKRAILIESTPDPKRFKSSTLETAAFTTKRMSDGAVIIKQPTKQFECPYYEKYNCKYPLGFDREQARARHVKWHVDQGHTLPQKRFKTSPLGLSSLPTPPESMQLAITKMLSTYAALTAHYPSTVGLFAPQHSRFTGRSAIPVTTSGWYNQMTKALFSMVACYSPVTHHHPFYERALANRIVLVPKEDKRKTNKGASKRASSSLKKRKRIVDKYEELSKEPDWKRPKNIKKTAGAIFNTAGSNVMRYWKDREQIRQFWQKMTDTRNRERASRSVLEMRRMPRQQIGRFQKAELALYGEFRDKRAVGVKITGLWLRLRFKCLVHDMHAKTVKGTRAWLYRFSNRFRVTARRRTAYKVPVKDRLAKIKRWHARLQCRLKRGQQVHPADGRWRLMNRFNVDQVPAVFGDTMARTYHAAEDGGRVTIQTGRESVPKRECTLQLCARYVNSHMASTQPRAAIIFRGKGIRIPEEERSSYDKRVDVYFQPRAWLDKYINAEWTERTFAPCTSYEQDKGDFEESVVFCDNLKTQTTPEWKRQLWSVGRAKLHLFPTGVTDELQTIDDGVGNMTKNHMGNAHTAWLEEETDGQTNLDRMIHGKVSASERRVLLTKFLGDAWHHVVQNYDFIHSGEKNGCALDVSAEKMGKIRLQGLDEQYSFTAEDGGLVAGSSSSEASECTENESTDCETIEMDEIEVVEEEEPTTDDDSDEDGPQNVDDDGGFLVPDGYKVLAEPPSDFSIKNLKTLGVRVAMKWPYGDTVGWDIGKIKQLITRAGPNKGRYEIRFEDGIEYFWPKEPTSQYGRQKKWVLIAASKK